MATNKSLRKRGVSGHKEAKCHQGKLGKLKGLKMTSKSSRKRYASGHQPGGSGGQTGG